MYVFYRLNLFLTPLFLIAAIAIAVNEAAAIDERQIKSSSFINYIPQTSEYQPALVPAVELIANGIRLKTGSNNKQAAEQLTKSVALLDSLIASSSRGLYGSLYFLRGLAKENLGQLKDALADYEKSLNYRSSNTLVLFHQAMVLKELKQCKKAVPKFEEVAWRTAKNSHESKFLAAECLIELGQKDQAQKLVLQAYQNNPRFLPVVRQLITHRKEQFAAEADPAKKQLIKLQILADLNIVVTQDPNDKSAALELAQLLLQGADPLVDEARIQQAENLAKRLVESSDYTDEESIKVLFDSYIKRGMISLAKDLVEKSLVKNPNSVVAQNIKRQLEIEEGIAEEREKEEGIGKD